MLLVKDEGAICVGLDGATEVGIDESLTVDKSVPLLVKRRDSVREISLIPMRLESFYLHFVRYIKSSDFVPQRTLIWRACKNSLPTKANLFRPKITPDGRCEICKQEDEDIMHALYRCSALQTLCTNIPAWNQGTLKQSTCFPDFIGFIFAGTANPVLFSLVLWNLWNRRNNLQLGKPTLPLDKVLEHSRERQLESHSSPLFSTKQRSTQPAAWIPPQDNWYKINFDGATFAEDKSAGMGVVIRKNKGRVMASFSEDSPANVENVKLPDSSLAQIDEKLSLKECEQKCLQNCSCTRMEVWILDREKQVRSFQWILCQQEEASNYNSGPTCYSITNFPLCILVD
uniref:Reverse transcriptase zinc-binding domain-containing protein n=1 Tax=Quercus lobata TaxID=97700 RepID=A0A7N2MMQ4_QUELO